MEKVGFIGVGTMGSLMVPNLLRAGYPVTVYDLVPERVAAMVQQGAKAAGSASETAGAADVVITMVPSSPNVEAALLGPAGALAGARPGTVFVDMSTIDPLVSRRLAQVVGEKGFPLLDAPVSGGTIGAKSGTLTIMVGGDAALLERYRPLLGTMGTNIIHCGGSGMGQVVKLANNLIGAVSMVAVAEAFAFGVKAGADPRTLFDVISKSTGNCWVLQNRVPYAGIVATSPAENDFAPGFMTDLMHKDLGLVLSAASNLKVPLLAAAVAQQLYAATSAAGYGRKDYSAVSKLLQSMVGE